MAECNLTIQILIHRKAHIPDEGSTLIYEPETCILKSNSSCMYFQKYFEILKITFINVLILDCLYWCR